MLLTAEQSQRILSEMDIDYSLENPYLDIFRKLNPRKRYEQSLNEDRFTAFDIRSCIMEQRAALVCEFACAVPNEDALLNICDAAASGIVSIGAGGGYWEHLLSRKGLPVAAFDIATAGQDKSIARRAWFPVQVGDERHVLDHPELSLFLCWPLEAVPVAFNSLSLYEGDQVVYVGEARGGWTADDRFFDMLDKEWNCVQQVRIPNWPPGVRDTRDQVWIYRRKRR